MRNAYLKEYPKRYMSNSQMVTFSTNESDKEYFE